MVWKVTFAARDGEMTFTIRVQVESASFRDKSLKMGMKEGLGQAVDQIEGIIRTVA
jgi:hypothetical protein